MKTITYRVIIFISLTAILFSCTAFSQDIDPFYLNLVSKGEQAFLDGSYEESIKQLKIAYFGIQTNNEIKAKVCVYMGLSYYYLNNPVEGQKYFKEAEELLGESGIETLDIDERARFDLSRLIRASKSGQTIRAEGLQALPLVPSERMPEKQNTSLKQLEQRIKDNPKNISQYYELYSEYRLINNFKEAKKTIEKLLKNNPEEPFGYYMLGLILYQERKFKDAASKLNLFFQQSANLQIGQETLADARACQILSLYYYGNRKDATGLINISKEILPISSIHSLRLADKDKIVLRGLLEEAYQ